MKRGVHKYIELSSAKRCGWAGRSLQFEFPTRYYHSEKVLSQKIVQQSNRV